MRERSASSSGIVGSSAREQTGGEILQTLASIASILGLIVGLASLPPWLGASQPAPAGSSVLRVLSEPAKTAVLLVSFPIFAILNVFLVLSTARISVSVLRRCGVELDTDLGVWCLLLLVLLPVTLGTSLLFMIVLFGNPFTPCPILLITGSILMTMYFAFRWLQTTLY